MNLQKIVLAVIMTLTGGLLSLPAWCAAGLPKATPKTTIQTATADLDGDGKVDKITLKLFFKYGEAGSYALQVNNAMIKGDLTPPIEGFKIIDIDKSDKFKEIAINTPGPSDDYESIVFWYDGKALKQVAHFDGVASFYGHGVVDIRDWMGFWEIHRRYTLDSKTRTLKEIPQQFYSVGSKAKVREAFKIYARQEQIGKKGAAPIVTLRAGGSATVLLWDPVSKYYLVKTDSSILGWSTEEQLFHSMALPFAD